MPSTGEEIDDDYSLVYETRMSKDGDWPNVLDFSVTLSKYSEGAELPEGYVARLRGFLVREGYLPEGEDFRRSGYADVFDSRSGHALKAFQILSERADLLREVVDYDNLGSVAYIERIWVHSKLRGNKIALRLLREARDVLARPGLLVMAKAHPDQAKAAEDRRKLANYYCSDPIAAFSPLSANELPGWVVAEWEDALDPGTDERLADLDVGALAFESSNTLT